MTEITKLQLNILKDLYKRDYENDISIRIQPESYKLEEKNSIMKIRELVYHIDYLMSMHLVETEKLYYIQSDSLSIEYLNNAIEIQDRRVKLSNLGIQYVEALRKGFLLRFYNHIKKTFNKTYTDHPNRVFITHLVAFLLGASGMWFILKFF